MKIAVVYNRDSRNVINLFGVPNREKIGFRSIKRIVDSLKTGGHQTLALEADKDLIEKLEEFMPRVMKGELPGMVFNVSYGIQGQARYTHVPSILEMLGIPYVGSGPLAHSIALDKVVTKMMLVQNGLPTPEFAVLESRDFEVPEIDWPMIVKPKNEAVSFGIKVVRDEGELREAAGRIFEEFSQPVLVERYIEGREINVGLLGNNPPEALPPVELKFDEAGEKIYSYEDKTGRSGREIELLCPAPLDKAILAQARKLALKSFSVVGCCDCARVDMRLDREGGLHILEINSLPSLGWHGSFVHAAEVAGLDFPALANRLVEVASARYFGTPNPPQVQGVSKDPEGALFSFISQRRDSMESRLRDWVRKSSRTSDPVGMEHAAGEMKRTMAELGLRSVQDFTDSRAVHTWETKAGMSGGTLIVLNLDVPLGRDVPSEPFRREPEWLYGEGIAASRAAIVILEFALRALRHQRLLRSKQVGVSLYADEGRDCRYSGEILRRAMSAAKRVLVLRPGSPDGHYRKERRGLRRYRLLVEGEPIRPGRSSTKRDVLPWFADRVGKITALSSRKDRLSASVVSVRTEAFPMLLPHRVKAEVLLTYYRKSMADDVERTIRGLLGRGPVRWELELISDRPSMMDRAANRRLQRDLERIAAKWDIPFSGDTAVWPSVAGLSPSSTGAVCGLGAQSRDLYTPREAVSRISLVQRTLMLAAYLHEHARKG